MRACRIIYTRTDDFFRVAGVGLGVWVHAAEPFLHLGHGHAHGQQSPFLAAVALYPSARRVHLLRPISAFSHAKCALIEIWVKYHTNGSV